MCIKKTTKKCSKAKVILWNIIVGIEGIWKSRPINLKKPIQRSKVNVSQWEFTNRLDWNNGRMLPKTWLKINRVFLLIHQILPKSLVVDWQIHSRWLKIETQKHHHFVYRANKSGNDKKGKQYQEKTERKEHNLSDSEVQPSFGSMIPKKQYTNYTEMTRENQIKRMKCVWWQ